MHISRRLILGAALALPASKALAGECPDFAPPPSMARLARRKGLTIGSALSVEELNDEDKAFFVSQVASITPETGLKMSAIRPDMSEWNFRGADAIVEFALAKAMLIRGHTLIWNNAHQPGWLNGLSSSELQAVVDEHIEKVMNRYYGRIKTWDVVNEPVGTTAYETFSLREGPFLARLGLDYIANSFRRARLADPTAKLVLNETHTERDDAFGLMYRRELLALIDHLLEKGVPVDGIGLQGHLPSDAPFNPEAFGTFLAEIARRGLFIEITELDVNDNALPDDIETRDRKVAESYTRFLDVALANKAVRSITFWQLGDRNSHYYSSAVHAEPSASRRPRPLPFDLRLRPKPALHAVIEALQRVR